jgi:hypothetical protein
MDGVVPARHVASVGRAASRPRCFLDRSGLPAAASEAAPGAHGVTQLSSTLPLTGTDALVLVGFAGAVLVPGIGLTIVSRRQRRGAHMA